MSPPASPALPALVWDPALATIALNWANTCTDANGDGLLDHNSHRGDTYPDSVGENIYASTGTATPADAVNAWDSEAQDYDLAANTCDGASYNFMTNLNWDLCGHYTQLANRGTLKVGCAIVRCSNLFYSSTAICDYSPAGNIADSSGLIAPPY